MNSKDKFKRLFTLKTLNDNGENLDYPESYDDKGESLFFRELPLIKTNEQLDIVKSCYKYDPYYLASGCSKKRKILFDNLWVNYKPYADLHFPMQIKTNFHQRTWEMYMGNVLLDKKLSIKSRDEVPDFIVNDKIYIECVAPTKGDPTKPDSVPEMFVATSPKEIHEQDVAFHPKGGAYFLPSEPD